MQKAGFLTTRLISEPVDGFSPNLHRYIVEREKRAYLDFGDLYPYLYPYFQGQETAIALKCQILTKIAFPDIIT